MHKEVQSLFKLYIIIVSLMLAILLMGCAPMPAVKFTKVKVPPTAIVVEVDSPSNTPIQIEIDNIETEIKEEGEHVIKTKDKKERENRAKRIDELHRRLRELKSDSNEND